MQKMLVRLCTWSTLAFLAQESLIADAPVKDSYGYISYGVTWIAPKVSCGYRFQKENFGGDISVAESLIPGLFCSQGIQLIDILLFLKKEDSYGGQLKISRL